MEVTKVFGAATLAGAVGATLLGLAVPARGETISLGTNSGWQVSFDAQFDSFVDVVVDAQTSDTLFLE
jgi:hypothetical protein